MTDSNTDITDFAEFKRKREKVGAYAYRQVQTQVESSLVKELALKGYSPAGTDQSRFFTKQGIPPGKEPILVDSKGDSLRILVRDAEGANRHIDDTVQRTLESHKIVGYKPPIVDDNRQYLLRSA